MNNKSKVVVVLGPTATGKSDLAVEIARSYNGEIISADSRQVYTGMDIGSGKITKREMRGVAHHLLDVASPKTRFTVATFQKKASRAIADITKRGKLPILCGGTGFYIDAVIFNQHLPEVPPNKKLRKLLETYSLEKLQSLLKKQDPDRYLTIDIYNRVRLVRALEIIDSTGSVPSPQKTESPYDVVWIGLDWSDNVLKKRIHDRLVKRIRQGMVAETKRLHAQGVSYKRLEELGLEYRYTALFLQNKISRDDMISELETQIWHFVKRQRTWWKRNKNIVWFKPTAQKTIMKTVRKFFERN